MTDHPTLAAALVAASADLTVVDKGHKANAGSYSYDYADLADVVKDSRATLAEHGVVALTPVCDHGDDLAVSVILLHTSGDRLDFGPLSFPRGRDAQATGSAITYHRRYALLSSLGMAAGNDDDDGATAEPAPKRQAKPAEPMADEGTHAAIRSMIANLPEDLVAQFRDWYTAQRLPSIKTRDALTVEQANTVCDFIDELDKSTVVQEEPTVPGPDAPPAPAGPVVKPATNSPAARIREGLKDGSLKDQPALGAVRNAAVADEDVQAHFPGSEVVAS